MKRRLILFIPLVIFFVMGIFLWQGLKLDPRELPSALIGKPFPEFTLNTVKDEKAVITEDALKGEVSLVNVWATWCPTCKYEHPYLVDVAKNPNVKLYGLNYKDDRLAAQQWLEKYEDPYVFSIYDEEGSLGLDLGVFGAPETFVIDHNGIIRKRFAGAIDTRVWRRQLEPLIAQLIEEKKQGK